MKRTLFPVIILIPAVLFIMTGLKAKEKKHPELMMQVDLELDKDVKLQVEAVLKRDSLDNYKNLISDGAFIERYTTLQAKLSEQAKIVESLRVRILKDEVPANE